MDKFLIEAVYHSDLGVKANPIREKNLEGQPRNRLFATLSLVFIRKQVSEVALFLQERC